MIILLASVQASEAPRLGLEFLNSGKPYEYFILPETIFQNLPVFGPPFPVDYFGHNFYDDYVIMHFPSAGFPNALRWCTRKGCHTAKTFCQLLAHSDKVLIAAVLAAIAIYWKKDFDKMHSISCGPLVSLRGKWLAYGR